jgi:CRISPR-associated protein Cas1
MSTLYLTEQGSILHKTQRRLVIIKNKKIIQEIPIFKIDRILIFGNIQISTQALSFILDSGIICSFFSSQGKFKGSLRPVESGNVFLRIAQYERYLDKEFRVEISKTIVYAKINNEIKFLENYSKTNFKEIIEELKKNINNLKDKNSISFIMGIEGHSTSLYFKGLSLILKNKFLFEKREYHPPKDPANALLSFGYSLITNEIFSLLSGIGFDPYIGFFHELTYNRPSLALDIVEEFRTPVVDKMIVTLINKNIIKEEDFQREENSIYLNNIAKKAFLTHYEKRIQNYREIIKVQCHKLMDSVLNKKIYEPYLED